jgi:pilus assembly protein CpaB
MRLVLLLTAAIVSVIAGIMALQWSNKNMGPTTPATTIISNAPDVSATDVIVAREPIPVGTVITEEMLEKQPWPQHLILEGFITGDIKNAAIVGKVSKADIQAREPIIQSKIIDPEAPGFLAASITSGFRAVTVGTDAITGVAGYVFPGDRVDVLFTHSLPEQMSTSSQDQAMAGGATVTEVLASNVRVLAVNVRTSAAAAGLVSSMMSDGAPTALTLEVTEDMAQKIRLAEKTGSLSVALRSILDRSDDKMADPSRLNSLTHVSLGSGGRIGEAPVRVIRGAGKESAGNAAPRAPAGGGLGGLNIGNLLR